MIAASSAFFGFFETILGIYRTFGFTSGSKTTALGIIAGRLSEAMAPGLLGLFAATIAFAFHQYLSERLDAIDL